MSAALRCSKPLSHCLFCYCRERWEIDCVRVRACVSVYACAWVVTVNVWTMLARAYGALPSGYGSPDDRQWQAVTGSDRRCVLWTNRTEEQNESKLLDVEFHREWTTKLCQRSQNHRAVQCREALCSINVTSYFCAARQRVIISPNIV